MKTHCAHARLVWNLALEQANAYRPLWGPTPDWNEQSRQVTELRAAYDWFAAGSVTVQHQALRDFQRAMQDWWKGTHRHPTWRKAGVHEGFRIITKGRAVRRLNRRWAEVFVPKVGCVRFRWTREVGTAKSYRVTMDQAGRWHIAFAVVPAAIDRENTGAVVGIDRGVTSTLATSDGDLSSVPPLTTPQRARLVHLQRKFARQAKGSARRERTRLAIARIRAHEADAVKDWTEKVTTELVRSYDLIAIEDLRIPNMVRKARGKRGLNREIHRQSWGLFARRLEEKCALAGVTLVKVPAVNTSRRCAGCGHVAAENRKSQAVFVCVACGHEAHADVNAAINILAAGRAVAARGGPEVLDPVKREPRRAAA